MQIKVESTEEKALKTKLFKRTDTESARMRQYLSMPDLSRTPGSPLNEVVERILAIPDYKNFDVIEVPEIVRTDVSFDLFDFPNDHPARSKSDTYYIDREHVLRTHTTVMWNYYLSQEGVRKRMAAGEAVGSFCYGKVYRKDEVDRNHMNVFHQIDGWYLAPKDKKLFGIPELEKVLSDIAKAVFGENVKYRFNPDTFPYTDPSLEMEVEVNGRWVEVLGSGVVKGKVLENHGVDSNKWNGWAFGFGLERLVIISTDLPDIRLLWSSDERVVKQLQLGHKFQAVSKFPPIVRDISFVVPNTFIPNDYFDLIREVGESMIENVEIIDKYENVEKFGPEKLSYTFRVTYRHLDRTLTNDEVNKIHAELESRTEADFKAVIRRV